jgi:Lrp/AsnC family leucine-responsive transcriptional regulator
MVKKIEPETEKTDFKPSEVDYKIVNILMQNGRATLKDISEKVGLSIDAIKDHIVKMKNAGAIEKFTVHLDPDFFGLPLSSQVYVKLKNVSEDALDKFLKYLKKDPQIITLISVLGSFDMFIVMMAKSPVELEKKKNKIREDFKELIANWDETIVSKIHKLEEYEFK